MKISIITCTLNSLTFLPYTVDSVLSQTHHDIEYIFVDGGSTDGTLGYIERIQCPKHVIYNVRGGIAAAMNAGARDAHGDILCHLHSDDYFLHSRVLARVASYFEANKPDWLFGRILRDIDGALVPEHFQPPAYSYKKLLQSNFVPHPATFIRTSVFRSIGGFRNDLRFAMDYELFLRLGLRHEPLALNEALAVFRRHAESTTQKDRLASFEEDYRVRLQYASGHPWERAMHAARYLIRRRRLVSLLKHNG